MQQCQGENSYLPTYCISLCGSALRVAGSYLEESWLWLRRVEGTCKSFEVGPINTRVWTWTLVSPKLFSASPESSSLILFSSGAQVLPPIFCQAERMWQISSLGTQEQKNIMFFFWLAFWLWLFISGSFTQSHLPTLAFSSRLYTGVISRCPWKSL